MMKSIKVMQLFIDDLLKDSKISLKVSLAAYILTIKITHTLLKDTIIEAE